MDRVELIAVLVAGGVVVVAIIAVFVIPTIGGDRRLGPKESDYGNNAPSGGDY